jgi:hypothetical protein
MQTKFNNEASFFFEKKEIWKQEKKKRLRKFEIKK